MSTPQIVKTVKGGALLKDGDLELIRIDRVRFSFPKLGVGDELENEESGKISKVWQCTGMLPKSTHVEVKDLIVQVIERVLAANKATVARDKKFISNGDDSEREEYKGHWIVVAAERRRPKVRDKDGNPIVIELDGEKRPDVDRIDEMFYGGCWGSMLIRPWYYDGRSKGAKKTYPKRVSAGLVGVMFYKDDTSFGQGRIDDTDAWGAGDGGSSKSDDDGLGGDDGL